MAESLGIKDAGGKLGTQSLEDAVLASDRYAKQDLNIHGVPHFVIGAGHRGIALHGAQSVEAFEAALSRQLSLAAPS